MHNKDSTENESPVFCVQKDFETKNMCSTKSVNNKNQELTEMTKTFKNENVIFSNENLKKDDNKTFEFPEQNEQEEEVNLFTDIDKLQSVNREIKKRRKEIPPRANHPLHLWSIIKNCIGKDLSKLPLPVNFSEPISFLQRLTEELEYSNLLDIAAKCSDQWEQLAYIAAFTISSYSTTSTRINKPFNPLLGETFECDRLDDKGWRSLIEQVSHHPPGLALHVESLNDWVFYQDIAIHTKFRGYYLQVNPLGTCHLELKSGVHFTWSRVCTYVNNMILGKLWIENVGDVKIHNHTTKESCFIKYHPNSFFSRESKNKVTAVVTDSKNIARYFIKGSWSDKVEGGHIINPQEYSEKREFKVDEWKVLWERKYPPVHYDSMHHFTEFAVELNEMEPNIAPTDSRLRPDQRLMEEGKWDEANQEKIVLEDKQRARRRQMETECLEYRPSWFTKGEDEYTNEQIYMFNREYWECKNKQDWARCLDIF